MTVEHQRPCNLFAVGSPVSLAVSLRGFPAAAGTLTAATVDYFGGQATATWPCHAATNGSCTLRADLGTLAPGYYESVFSVAITDDHARVVSVRSERVSFGVVAFTNRTAAQARLDGSRFGLKIFQIGSPGIWWRRPLRWELAEAVDACAALGLQWTRHSLSQGPDPAQPGVIATLDLATNHAMNVVLKVEGFPENCYDAVRYGAMDDWKKRKKSWSRCSVPLKAPYQQWLRDEIRKLPPEQNIFEIGNEVWDYMSAEEFAAWCQLVAPVVHEVRPDAVVGADSGGSDYAERFFAAGGMTGLNATFLHPYSFTPMPEHRIRPWLRNLHDTFRARIGHDLPLYVTEYGWSTAPQDPKYGRTERQQAQRTVRESLMLYAEGCKTLIPHWMADREQDPKEREHWFGFFRLNAQPKPVLVAHAVSARMVDCSRFMGDLWLGPGINAMLFERAGVQTLALWNLDEAPGTGRDLVVDVGAPTVTVVDLMGRARQASAPGGRLPLRISGDVTYVVGVSPALAQRVVTPDQDLIDACWSSRPVTNLLMNVQHAPAVDGHLDDWPAQPAIALADPAATPSAPPAAVWLARDDTRFYMAARVPDAAIANRFDPAATGKVARITDGDAIELTLCTRPSRQTSSETYGALYEYTLAIAPASATGQPALQFSNILLGKPVTNPTPQDPSGIRWAVARTSEGWTAEASIPISLLKGFPEPKPGAWLSLQVTRVEAGTPGTRPTRTCLVKTESHLEWAALKLAE